MFKMRKPRKFNPTFIYHDERKERLKKMEKEAKRDLGMIPKKEFFPEDLRGKFVEQSTHLKKRKRKSRQPIHVGVLIVLIFLLLYVWHYLHTGSLTF